MTTKKKKNVESKFTQNDFKKIQLEQSSSLPLRWNMASKVKVKKVYITEIRGEFSRWIMTQIKAMKPEDYILTKPLEELYW